MASAFSHAVVALALGKSYPPPVMTWPVLFLGMVCSIMPDLDVAGFSFGIQYGDLWGHRGMTHSLSFAALFSAVLVGLCFRRRSASIKAGLCLYLFLCTASHGVLDAMTDGGLGVAFFSPFDTTRYFLPFRPVAVSPIGVSEFFSQHSLGILASEIQWIWFPALATLLFLRGLQRLVLGPQPVTHPLNK